MSKYSSVVTETYFIYYIIAGRHRQKSEKSVAEERQGNFVEESGWCRLFSLRVSVFLLATVGDKYLNNLSIVANCILQCVLDA
jgi:hypothetical protein